MTFTWNWLKDFADLDGLDPLAVADRFTLTVAELEGVERVGEGLDDVRTARVASLEPHPAEPRWCVVALDLGGHEVRCVSGAPNLGTGVIVPVALPGARLPGGVTVQAREMRGVASEAVVLSEAEMGLSDDHSGVLILPPETPVGVPLPDAVPIEDVVFEVDNKAITHRPDLWGHWGIAREVAAMTGRALRDPPESFPEGRGPPLRVVVDDPEDCPRYMAMAYVGVRVVPSPFWVARRLRLCGMRPISNVVDLTNYVMLAVGEPVHAFDRRQIRGDEIRVRRALPGEPFRTLDGQDHSLCQEDLLIADAERGIALAGVMGGEDSGIADDTTDVVLECATFHPGRIRKTSVRHGIRTESSARFEKSLDPRLPLTAMALFTRMLPDVSPGAAPSTRVADAAAFPRDLPRIRLDPGAVSRRLGVEVSGERTTAILGSLGFAIERAPEGVLDVRVPSHRATRDVSIPEDLIEEVGRVVGYDRIPPVAPPVVEGLVPRDPMRALVRQVRHLLAFACGLDEVMTYSFPSESLLARLRLDPGPSIRLRNTLSADHQRLRTEIAHNLLGALERNATQLSSFGLFEVGRVFRPDPGPDGLPSQPRHAAWLLYERTAASLDASNALFRRGKGIVAFLLDRLDLSGVSADAPPSSVPPWAHPKRVVAVTASGMEVGVLAGVHPAVMGTLGCPGAAVVTEVDLDRVLESPRRTRCFTPVPRFPAIQADLSFVLDEDARAGDLLPVVREQAGETLAGVEFVTEYRGPPLPAGQRSVTFRLTFQAPDRTLADAGVRDAVARVIAAARAAGIGIREA